MKIKILSALIAVIIIAVPFFNARAVNENLLDKAGITFEELLEAVKNKDAKDILDALDTTAEELLKLVEDGEFGDILSAIGISYDELLILVVNSGLDDILKTIGITPESVLDLIVSGGFSGFLDLVGIAPTDMLKLITDIGLEAAMDMLGVDLKDLIGLAGKIGIDIDLDKLKGIIGEVCSLVPGASVGSGVIISSNISSASSTCGDLLGNLSGKLTPVDWSVKGLPVAVFGDYINNILKVHKIFEVLTVNRVKTVNTVETVEVVEEINAGTSMENSLEQFMFTLAQSMADRQEAFTKSFELAKIEKAREDVNKLNFEVQRELAGNGVIFPVEDPVTGKKYTVKKEGRIITNPDDFLYEEPIQKARDFVYCYLAPWKHFSLENDAQYCGELGLGDDPDIPCTSQNVCATIPSFIPDGGIRQCPSDITRDKIKTRLLNDLVRKQHKWAIAPPESWYTPALCEKIMNSYSCVNKDKCFVSPLNTFEGTNIEDVDSLSSSDITKINSTHSTVDQNVAFNISSHFLDFQETASNPNNSANSLEKTIRSQMEGIVSQYQALRQTQYIAGQGLRPEKYLIAVKDNTGVCDRYYDLLADESIPGRGDCLDDDVNNFGRPLDKNFNNSKPLKDVLPTPTSDIVRMSVGDRAYSDQIFWFDTENIVSPAVVLIQKMAAATQAQFDLARQAYKDPDELENIGSDSSSISSNGGFSQSVSYTIPGLGNLPAPWEDTSDYADLEKSDKKYFEDTVGQSPKDLGVEGNYLNRWYKEVNQMYLPQTRLDDVLNPSEATFDRVLKEWFCNEDDVNFESCFEDRDPKYNE